MQKARGRLSAPTACRRTVSGSLSLPCSGFFPPFPHGTGPLSVFRSYLALRDGPRGFGQDSSCPALLRWASPRTPVTRTGLSPSADRLSRRFRFLGARHLRPPTTPAAPRRRRFGLLPFRSPLLRESIFLSSPAGTKMFQFPALAPALRPVRGIRPRGFPHSDSHGSLPVCGSPWICAAFGRAGSPIRTPTDHFPFADPRGFSQLTASFLASGSPGIPRSPFSSFSRALERRISRRLTTPATRSRLFFVKLLFRLHTLGRSSLPSVQPDCIFSLPRFLSQYCQ